MMENRESFYHRMLEDRALHAQVQPFVTVEQTELSEQQRKLAESRALFSELLLLPEDSPEILARAAQAGVSPADYKAHLSIQLGHIDQALAQKTKRSITYPTMQFLDLVTEQYMDAMDEIQYQTTVVQPHLIKKLHLFQIASGLLAALSIVLIVAFYIKTPAHPEQVPAQGNSASVPIDSAIPSAPSESTPSPAPPPVTHGPTLPYPANGEILFSNAGDCPAPLTFQTDAGLAYCVKLCTLEGDTVMTYFIGPSASVDVSAPLGTYRLRYACGVAWYGTTPMFGESAEYYEYESNLDFTYENNTYNGWTVPLYAVPGGDAYIKALGPDEF